jgi:endonuclease/exonuclease/phosphatase family metal-dependent hydrolase
MTPYSRSMPNHLPGRRAVLLAGLAGLAGCTVVPRAGQPGDSASGAPTSPTPISESAVPSVTPPTGTWRTRVMTYNMLTSIRTAADFNPAVPLKDVELARRAPVMARWITTAGADIIGLQENEANSPAELPIRALAPLLPGFTQVHPELEVPLLFRDDAFTLSDAGSLLLSKKFYVRYLSWCWLTHKESGGRLLVANTHLDPFQRLPQARARSAEVDLVISKLRKLNPTWTVPTVLLGDLNTRSDETRSVYRDALVKLPGAGLRNSARVAARDVSRVPRASSKNDFGTEINGTWRYRAIRTDGMTYDYAFVSPGVAVRSWQVVTGPGVRRIDGHPFFADGPVPSDHCPVQVELSVKAMA